MISHCLLKVVKFGFLDRQEHSFHEKIVKKTSDLRK